MQYRLIVTKFVYGNRGTRTVTVDRYSNTLLGAMREGTRLISCGVAKAVSVVDPVTNRIIKTRSRGQAKWMDVEDDHVPTHQETRPPD